MAVHGGLDFLFNNAGVFFPGEVEDIHAFEYAPWVNAKL